MDLIKLVLIRFHLSSTLNWQTTVKSPSNILDRTNFFLSEKVFEVVVAKWIVIFNGGETSLFSFNAQWSESIICSGLEIWNSQPKVLFSISQNISYLFHVVKSRSHTIHLISIILSEIMLKLKRFSLESLLNRVNWHSQISRFMQLVRSLSHSHSIYGYFGHHLLVFTK